jgi:iron(III) transport system substrate-binding protein
MKRSMLGAVLTVLMISAAYAQETPTATAEYKTIIEAAKTEGKAVLYSTFDAPTMRPLIDDFQSLYPGVSVDYNDLQTTVLYNRYLSETAAKSHTADVLWSPAMDLLFKLVQDGNAMKYASVEKPNLPDWASYEDQLYSLTLEPTVFVYNKNVLKDGQVPKSHADLVKILDSDPAPFQGRIVSYDIEKSATGFLMISQDDKHMKDFWRIPELFGKVRAQFPSGSGFMIETVGSGENVFGYNQLGSYAAKAAKSNPSIGVIYPSDYTTLTSRVAFISKGAPHPNAAKLLLDYLLSARAQKIITDKTIGYSVRSDIDSEWTPAGVRKLAGGDSVKPVYLGTELTEYLDTGKRTEFLARWRKTLGGAK